MIDKNRKKVLTYTFSIGFLMIVVLLMNIRVQTKDNPIQAGKYDFTLSNANEFAELDITWPSVLQSFVIDEKNNHIYATQVISAPGNGIAESFGITRMSIDGKRLDSMELEFAGHGTNIGLENRNGKIYIWASYDKTNGNGALLGDWKLVYFEYKPGERYNQNSPELIELTQFRGTYYIPTIDNKNRQIVLRHGMMAYLYNLDEVIVGKKNPIGTVNVPEDLSYFQGHSVDEGILYWYSGDTNRMNYPFMVTSFDFYTGERLYQREIYIGKGASLDFIEPEGIYIYTDPITKNKALMVGIVTGPVGGRINSVYTYNFPLENYK
ncbi:hypothetical protein M3181_03615 [Mesobacillus maritimus]|uniref:phage baseplate protein n=1 Tax=Mesobacillus maritimus TaxID=1643336 RepID=UPI00203CCE50|nr:hypothetical protein [Mesobacillus maritimus]MCM3668089.1 hypothetical protein [Mesobacillus maritimus]